MLILKRQFVGEVEVEGFGKFNPRKHGVFSADTEGTGLRMYGACGVDQDHWPARPFAFSMCDGDGNTAYVRWPVNAYTRRVYPEKHSLELLQDLFADKTLTKVFHNFSYDGKSMRKQGVPVRGDVLDTLILHTMLDPGRYTYGLKPLAEELLDVSTDDEEALLDSTRAGRRLGRRNGWKIATEDTHGKEPTKADYWLADPALCKQYAVLDAVRTMQLHALQQEMLEDLRNEDPDYYEVVVKLYAQEIELMHALNAMEHRGVAIDTARTREIVKFYESTANAADKKVEKLAGAGFNTRSPKQMTQLFFGDLGHQPIEYSRKGKRGRLYVDCQHCKGEGCNICQGTGRNPKCDKHFLASIALDADGKVIDDLAHTIMVANAAKTMKGYCSAYIDRSATEGGVKVLHPNYKQAATATDRLACEDPNLQNVASDDSGNKKVDLAYRSRECFVPRPGFTLLIPDYSQIEVWLLALASGDSGFIEMLARGGDAHQNVSDLVFPGSYNKEIAARAEHKDPDKRTELETKHYKAKVSTRKKTKVVNFSIIYGQGKERTAKLLGVSQEECARIFDAYHAALPAVSEFMEATKEEARRYGYVTNLYGRRFPVKRSLAYIGANYKIQSSAAQLMKNALRYLHGMSKEKRYKGWFYPLLNIHDEVLAEVVSTKYSLDVVNEMCKRMSQDYRVLGAPVPFPVGMKVATTRWSESKEL